jgi:hypothetical protein
MILKTLTLVYASGAPAARREAPRHRCEQYLTCSQSRAHFLRHVKGRWQTSQRLVGRSDLERDFGMLGRASSNL